MFTPAQTSRLAAITTAVAIKGLVNIGQVGQAQVESFRWIVDWSLAGSGGGSRVLDWTSSEEYLRRPWASRAMRRNSCPPWSNNQGRFCSRRSKWERAQYELQTGGKAVTPAGGSAQKAR
jgi:hypothetical protein